MHASLAHRVLLDARVQAFRFPMLGRPSVGFMGGVVLDEEDAKLRQRRHGTPWDCFDPDAAYTNRINGEKSYGGMIHQHFGHFMSEMVHRIVPIQLMRERPRWLFVTVQGPRRIKSVERLPAFVGDVLKLLGVESDDLQIFAENSIVERLFVVEQGSELGVGPKPGYLDDLKDYVTPRLDRLHGSEARPSKVYVSRGGMLGGSFFGERYLEEVLKAEDFFILQPETLPITMQMDIYRKADVLLFTEGSACHGVELLGAESLKRCYLLARRVTHYRNFENILRPRAVDFATSDGHPFIGTIIDKPQRTRPMLRLGMNLFDPKKLVAFFRDHGIAKLANFDEREYFHAAEADLERHIKESAASGMPLRSSEDLAAFVSTFHETKASIGGSTV